MVLRSRVVLPVLDRVCALFDVSIWTRMVRTRTKQNPSVHPLLVRRYTHMVEQPGIYLQVQVQ
jgi:hypothetical protein